MVGVGTNALASSIVLVCRPRPDNAPLATRKQFLTDLHKELPEALRNLQRGNIAPVDLAQAAIGPGMAVFTRYAKVLESDGTPMTVRTALGPLTTNCDEPKPNVCRSHGSAQEWHDHPVDRCVEFAECLPHVQWNLRLAHFRSRPSAQCRRLDAGITRRCVAGRNLAYRSLILSMRQGMRRSRNYCTTNRWLRRVRWLFRILRDEPGPRGTLAAQGASGATPGRSSFLLRRPIPK